MRFATLFLILAAAILGATTLMFGGNASASQDGTGTAAPSHELRLASTTPSPTAHASTSATPTAHSSATPTHAASPTAAAVPKSGGPPSDGSQSGWLPYLMAGLGMFTVTAAASLLATRKVRS